MLTFRFSGADGEMTVRETLTSGMVGKQVKLEFTDDWAALNKTAVFTAGTVTRDLVNVSDVVTIPSEVLEKPMQQLFVGVYGVSADGTVVIPTVRAAGPNIDPGVNPSGDPSVDPALPVWSAIQSKIGDLDDLNTGSKESLVAAINALNANVEKISGSLATELHSAFVNYFTHVMPQFDDGNGMKYVNAILNALGAEVRSDVGSEDDEIEATLTGISVVYSGGDVAVGTAVTALAGLVVTAVYSDRSTEAVADYTLSGTIAEGSNIITVSYGGLTTTFTVTGVAESGGEETPDPVTYAITNALTNVTSNNSAASVTGGQSYTATLTAADGYTLDTVTVTMDGINITSTAYADGVVNIASVTGAVVITATATAENTGWEDGVAYIFENWTDDKFLNGVNGESAFAGYSCSDYMPCNGASTLSITATVKVEYNQFYDSKKKWISKFSITASTTEVTVPEGAAYFRLSGRTAEVKTITVVPHA